MGHYHPAHSPLSPASPFYRDLLDREARYGYSHDMELVRRIHFEPLVSNILRRTAVGHMSKRKILASVYLPAYPDIQARLKDADFWDGLLIEQMLSERLGFEVRRINRSGATVYYVNVTGFELFKRVHQVTLKELEAMLNGASADPNAQCIIDILFYQDHDIPGTPHVFQGFNNNVCGQQWMQKAEAFWRLVD